MTYLRYNGLAIINCNFKTKNMTTLRKNEFMDMLEMRGLLFEDKDKFLHCDIPTLGKVTYYPKADKLQINRTNKWEEGGFQFVKNILSEKTINTPIQQATSLVKIKEVKSDEELRNDFAGLALNGILSNRLMMNEIDIIVNGNSKIKNTLEYVADLSYSYADEMVKRSKL